MPSMIGHSSPPGEKWLFEKLKTADNTEDWFVLHSLGLARHRRQYEGEADFIVIVPERGVAVIEVKSHTSIARKDGVWLYGQKCKPGRDPFQQVAEQMYSIREFVTKKLHIDTIPFTKIVWFTHAHVETSIRQGVEWKPYEILDASATKDPVHAILRSLDQTIKDRGRTVRSGQEGFSLSKARKVAKALRPNFETAEALHVSHEFRQDHLLKLLDEQYEALDSQRANPRVIFEGAAGTGKTFVAVEAAQRASGDRKRTALLCYNRSLADHLKRILADSGVDVYTIHQLMTRIAQPTDQNMQAQEYWTDKLPALTLDALADGRLFEQYDVLVIDEAQDFGHDGYMLVLDALVDGGLENGSVYVFGDFHYQSIFSEHASDLWEHMLNNPPKYMFTTNCRNLPRIGRQVELVTSASISDTKYRRDDDHVNPIIEPYNDWKDQEKLVTKAVRKFGEEGYRDGDIVILSPIRHGAFAADRTSIAGKDLREYSYENRDSISWSTIQAFKGLEAPAVIITDIDYDVNPKVLDLLYTGLTRAQDRLALIVSSKTLKRLISDNEDNIHE